MMTRPDFTEYWSGVAEEVAKAKGEKAEVSELPIRSTGGSTGYAVTIIGTGGYRLFAWYSVPRGRGPFPALLQTPGYGSVVGVPAYEPRQKYVVLALCHRGQRKSDKPYAASYPGLLTDGIDNPDKYVFRDIVADCLSVFDFLLSRREVDKKRIAVTGNDLAYMTAGLRPQTSAVLVTGELLFRAVGERRTRTSEYPIEEFNDYLRTFPRRRDAVEATLGLFDPLGFASMVKAKVMISCAAPAKGYAAPLAKLVRQGDLRVAEGRGHTDHVAEEKWIDGALAG